ncbi:methionine aminotransferase [Sodalis sp. dw_96]|uniref:methionine aminotransferase n=1 Tax=Sodalis sp. dw_96 TaxID=2719794 RepID=UPI001BD4A5B0|nr:methionine aminotransferase [Sodalis sp. dw_96]
MQSVISARSKLPDVGTTIFTTIGQLSAEHNAVNLAAGSPSFDCDPLLVDYTAAAMRAGHNQYSAMTGLPALREALAQKVATLYGAHYDPAREITILASASQGLYSAISALVHPGDDVIYFEPAFDSYSPITRLQGAVPVAVKMSLDDLSIDWDAVAAAVTPRTRMIIVNSPHNPTGMAFSEEDIRRLTALTDNTDILILSDEVYEHMVFDGQPHRSMAAYPTLAARSVVVSSFGKTYGVTGWRVGYCLAPAELMWEIRKVHQFMVFAADTPMQFAFATALENPESYLRLPAFYQRKRDLLTQALASSPFQVMPSGGSFFLLARFSHFTSMKDNDMVVQLIQDAKVSSIPLSAFYSDGTETGMLRLSFAKDDETLLEGARRLCAWRHA